jgi:hypothetical protein
MNSRGIRRGMKEKIMTDSLSCYLNRNTSQDTVRYFGCFGAIIDVLGRDLDEFHAYELKLKYEINGFRQALYNSLFFHYSSVVIESERIPKARAPSFNYLDLHKYSGIGLYVFNKNKLSEIIKPQYLFNEKMFFECCMQETMDKFEQRLEEEKILI